ncbi:MAG: uncharacterized protein KVP18_003991 [Porospora cf. gigantea A]|uniref:uncharacterized protein n=1 Tax=Porospora cf. gigantea A TaxID=2853593 RepID=UPI00355ABB38|nr:MAG: hypothetical protein KVP18_003991 [Porospora cf. gigantea A]
MSCCLGVQEYLNRKRNRNAILSRRAVELTLDGHYAIRKEPLLPKTSLSSMFLSAVDQRRTIVELRSDPATSARWLGTASVVTRKRPPSPCGFTEVHIGSLAPVTKRSKHENLVPDYSPSQSPQDTPPTTCVLPKQHPTEGPWSSSGLQQYLKVMKIGVGAYGEVWLAEDLYRKRRAECTLLEACFVAMKKIRISDDREGFPKLALREISLLRRLKHPHIVELLAVHASRPPITEVNYDRQTPPKEAAVPYASGPLRFPPLHVASVWMVMEYCPHDLSGLIEMKRQSRGASKISEFFSPQEVRCLMRGLLSSLDYIHQRSIIHRDLKTNLLIDEQGRIKLADFGLARFAEPNRGNLTNRVVTLWYRCPELLLGSESYDEKIDVWSAGCIFAELLLNRPLFMAEKEPQVLQALVETLGAPNLDDWPEARTLPLFGVPAMGGLLETSSPPIERLEVFKKKVAERAGDASGLDLLLSLLQWCPHKRISAAEALEHPWMRMQAFGEKLVDRLDMTSFKAHTHSIAMKKKNASKDRSSVPAVHHNRSKER